MTLQKWANANSFRPFFVVGACCRDFVVEAFPEDYFSGRSHTESNLLVIGGPITSKAIEQIKIIYGEMPFPKWVMRIGSCSSFEQAVNNELLTHIPVDVILDKCDMNVEDLKESLEKVKKVIST